MIAVITDPGIGGTFLTWTLYYLSGRTEYFSIKNQKTIDIPHNPLNTNNAHGFVANQPFDLNEFQRVLPWLIDKNEYLYMHQFRHGTKEAIDQLVNHTTKNIVLSLTKDQVLYQHKYKPRDLWNTLHIPRESDTHTGSAKLSLCTPDELYTDFVEYFFKESKLVWQRENLHNVWDKREFIALNFNFFKHDTIVKYIDSSVPRYWLNPMDLWTSFDQTVKDLFDYLELSIDNSRYQQWLEIYNQWKSIHYNNVMFVWYFSTIIDCILDNIDFDLKRFKLDITQEAAIQHFLMYNHNLNFKTWQLTEFTNTKQLHNLLEPNMHDLSKSLIDK
jgi:hypothetical protein